jgi:uncharacterized DUF497 family protein
MGHGIKQLTNLDIQCIYNRVAVLRYEWNQRKNRQNFQKHSLWFEEAQTVWADIRALDFFDPDSSDVEERFIRVGRSTRLNILVVVYAENEPGGLIRIISARKATRLEQEEYEKTI